MEQIGNDNPQDVAFVREQYAAQEAANQFVIPIIPTTAITSVNGITGPTVTISGGSGAGSSGFSFAPGGTTLTLVGPLTTKGDLYTFSTLGIRLGVGANGEILSADSTATTGLKWIANSTGTVTSISVATANGFAGTSSGGATPTLTLTTTVTGVLKGNGTAISAASSADIITALGYTPTDAAVVPSTAPSAGQILVGNAGNTAYARQTVSGSGATITLSSAGVITISGIANASLANSAITINGTSVSLGGTRTLTLASADFANQGTTTTVLHGNAAGNPSFGAVSLTADISGVLPIANGGTNNSTAYTSGSVVYSDGSKLTQDNSHLFYDASNVRLGINTASPGEKLDVNGTIRAFGQNAAPSSGSGVEISHDATTGYIQSYDRSGAGADTDIYISGKTLTFARNGGTNAAVVGSTGLWRMPAYGAGTATFDASGNITSVSDMRLKRAVRSFNRGLNDLLGLTPILHGYTEESGMDQSRDDYAGFSAQNVKEFIPEAIGVNADGTLTLTDRAILAVLVNAVKELNAKLS